MSAFDLGVFDLDLALAVAEGQPQAVAVCGGPAKVRMDAQHLALVGTFDLIVVIALTIVDIALEPRCHQARYLAAAQVFVYAQVVGKGVAVPIDVVVVHIQVMPVAGRPEGHRGGRRGGCRALALLIL